ncbi:MAG: HIT family protein [Candidatus Saccharibacteria bacterium]|nr:HIT family protein [Candidatus Saccharibacteria bacterium]
MFDNCEVCKVLPQNNPIFETDKWVATLAFDQGYLGRAYITLKEHKGDLKDLSEEEWLEFSKVLKKYEAGVRKAFNAEMFNWTCLMNNAYQTQPSQPHIHWHVRPRYSTEIEFKGKTYSDPEFAHHYDRNQKNLVNSGVLDAINEEIKSCLSD